MLTPGTAESSRPAPVSKHPIALFLRYKTQAHRHYRLAVKDFERLKAARPLIPNEPIEWTTIIV
jgi:hypothetical protein